MPTSRAGTRATYYRRKRLNGQSIDDIEACLSVVEAKSAPLLTDVLAGEPLTVEHKGGLAQLLAVQMMRGPAFFEHREETILAMLSGLATNDFKPQALAAVGGDVGRARGRLEEVLLDPTHRFMTMLTTSVKVATILSSMRWQIVRFDGPWLAYSDHPVVVWPLGVQWTAPFDRQGLAPLAALEVRVPLAPDVALIMNWIDLDDEADRRLGLLAAGELNAFTVAQADRQWMHRLDSEPYVPSGVFAPISRLIEPDYDSATALRSSRRATARRFVERVASRQYVSDVEVILDVGREVLPAAA
jgi:hypothetical protein